MLGVSTRHGRMRLGSRISLRLHQPAPSRRPYTPPGCPPAPDSSLDREWKYARSPALAAAYTACPGDGTTAAHSGRAQGQGASHQGTRRPGPQPRSSILFPKCPHKASGMSGSPFCGRRASPDMLATTTCWPRPCAAMRGSAARASASGPSRFRRSSAAATSGCVSSTAACWLAPAARGWRRCWLGRRCWPPTL